jgi:protein-L-isoaspartate(D-aspartate) O-methyltransferase
MDRDTAMDSTAVRQAFAQRIQREAGIQSAALIRGLATVPREDFVGVGPWQIMRPAEAAKGYVRTADANPSHIYDTVLVALDPERQLNNGEPSSLLKMLDSLTLTAGDRFLHIGCGVGYYTAITSVAVGPEGRVVGVELDPKLAAEAERKLKAYPNTQVSCADGSGDLPGPFDAIFVNAGCTHPPLAWLDELAVGGRLLVPLTVASPLMNIGAGLMLLLTRREDQFEARFTTPVAIFHCQGGRTDEAGQLLLKAFARRNSQSVSVLRRDEHAPTEGCWLHGNGYCLSA